MTSNQRGENGFIACAAFTSDRASSRRPQRRSQLRGRTEPAVCGVECDWPGRNAGPNGCNRDAERCQGIRIVRQRFIAIELQRHLRCAIGFFQSSALPLSEYICIRPIASQPNA